MLYHGPGATVQASDSKTVENTAPALRSSHSLEETTHKQTILINGVIQLYAQRITGPLRRAFNLGKEKVGSEMTGDTC